MFIQTVVEAPISWGMRDFCWKFFGGHIAGVRLAPNPCLPYGNPYGVRKFINNHNTILAIVLQGYGLTAEPLPTIREPLRG